MREVEDYLMAVSPISNVQAAHGVTGSELHGKTHHPAIPARSSNNSQQPADSVHLSAAAKAHLHADADGDGDGK